MLTRFINDRHYIDLTNYITKGDIIMDINTMKESGVAPSYAEIEQSLCEDAEAFLLWASPIIEIINKGKIPTTSELASDFLARL